MLRKRYAKETKQKMAELYRTGHKVKSLCHEYEVTKSAVYNWIHQEKIIVAPSGNETSVREVWRLKRKAARLERENEILKKSGCSHESPLNQKLEAMMSLKSEYSIHFLADMLGVRRSTFYHYQRNFHKMKMIDKEDEIFKTHIRDICEKSKYRFGAKKIRVKMMDRGFMISSKRILRLMEEMGLAVCTGTVQRIYSKQNKCPYYINRLNQQFNQTEPNKVWVSDITYVKVNSVDHYVCAVIDLFGRKVISYGISDVNDSKLVIETFNRAYEARKCSPEMLLFHSDRGVQYTAYEFKEVLRKLKVKQSFSNTGYPYDNAVAESFFASMKKEELLRNAYNDINQLEASVCEYVEFFNNERPHQSLKYLTPNQMEQKYYSSIKEAV